MVTFRARPKPTTARHAPNVIKFPFSSRRCLMARSIANPPTAIGASKPEAMVNKPMTAAARPSHQLPPPGFPNPSPARVTNEAMSKR